MRSLLGSLVVLGGLASAQSSAFAPKVGACAAQGPSIRLAGTPGVNQTLAPAEVEYIKARHALVPVALATYLGNLSSAVLARPLTSVPNIAISLSGGGDRAALFGAGVLRALDGREPESVAKGTGGLLQTASYITALSGGSWALSSFVFNGMPTVKAMVLGDNAKQAGWRLDLDLFNPGTGANETLFVAHILADLAAKKAAGFNVTFNDYWSRALSYHFLPGTTSFFSNETSDHGASLSFSSATTLPVWTSHAVPLPIIVANVLSSQNSDAPINGGDTAISNVVYEFSPLEFGSFDPQLAAFVPMSALGTTFSAGTPVNQTCVSGFDNAGFVLGTSSCLFNEYNVTHAVAWDLAVSPINIAWELVNATFYSTQPSQEIDVSAVPNPFMGVNAGKYEDANQTELRLIDGGLTGAVSPLSPLIILAREVDVIVVADSAGDSSSHTPVGQSLVVTQLQAQLYPNGSLALPPLPKSNATYISLGLNTRPTFFGCAGSPAQVKGVSTMSPYPIIVYLPNFEPQANNTNTATSQLVYNATVAEAFLDTTFDIATRGFPAANATADPLWGQCLACAVVERARARDGLDQTTACTACFSRYCWNEVESTTNGSVANSTTAGSGGAAKSAAPLAVSPRGLVGVLAALASVGVTALIM